MDGGKLALDGGNRLLLFSCPHPHQLHWLPEPPLPSINAIRYTDFFSSTIISPSSYTSIILPSDQDTLVDNRTPLTHFQGTTSTLNKYYWLSRVKRDFSGPHPPPLCSLIHHSLPESGGFRKVAKSALMWLEASVYCPWWLVGKTCLWSWEALFSTPHVAKDTRTTRLISGCRMSDFDQSNRVTLPDNLVQLTTNAAVPLIRYRFKFEWMQEINHSPC